MTSLGQELKKQRESRNISIDEMASSTKIVGRYIEALEQDRLEAMPGGFFVKGIIRTYAKYVGLDEAEILAKYREAGAFAEPVKSRLSEAGPQAARSEPAPAGRSKAVVWLFVVAAVVILLVAVTLALRSRRPRPVRKAAPPTTAAVLPQTRETGAQEPQIQDQSKPEASPAPGQQKADQEAAPAPPPIAQETAKEERKEEGKGLTLDMSFQEETWIQVYADGVLKVSGLFPAGGKARAVAEKEILIGVLGNAGGLSYDLNGKPGKALGRTGEVKNNIRITLDNQKDYLKEPTAPSN